MKYWIGYLVAAIVGGCAWALRAFAKAHSTLVDMIYPYVSRMIQNFLAGWSSEVSFCVWQVAVMVLLAVVLATFVLMLVMKWNPIRWLGWVLAGISVIVLLNMGIYGLNQQAGSLAADIRLGGEEYHYTLSELEEATVYYRDQANALAGKVERDATGAPSYPDFETLAQQAGDGFDVLTYQQHHAVFAGERIPVKQLGWKGLFTGRGVSGMMVPLTGEAAVNPNTPVAFLPYAMCQQMARRICIARDADANLAAYMAANANPQPYFQYAANLAAYRYCWGALEAVCESTGSDSAVLIAAKENDHLQQDLQSFTEFFGKKAEVDGGSCDLLVQWHVQQIVLPQQVVEEEEELFDPRDPNQVDLSGLVNAPTAPAAP